MSMKSVLILFFILLIAGCTTLEQAPETAEESLEETPLEEISDERIEEVKEEVLEEKECTEEQMDSCDAQCGIGDADEEIDEEKELCFETCVNGIPCSDPLAEDDEGDNACNFQEASEEIVFEEEGQVIANDEIVNLEVIALSDGSYRMFYHFLDEIFSASSTDAEAFTLENDLILEGKMPSTIQLEDGSYRMYYSDENSNIMSALSEDGKTFTKESGTRLAKGSALDAYGLLHPSILLLPDGSYKIYYDGQSTSESEPSSWQILSANSEDGLTWTKDSGQRIELDEECELDYATSAHVLFENGIYRMYFMSEAEDAEFSGIWLAESSNGIRFEIIGDEPILGADEKYFQGIDTYLEGGPAGLPQDPFVLNVDGGQRIFYWKNDEGIYSAFREL